VSRPNGSGVDVITSVVIRRPRDQVAAFAADPDNFTRWYRNISSVGWRSSPPLSVGTRLDFVARFMGRELTYTYEVHDLVPGERLVMRTAQGPFPMETTYTWEDADGATRITLRNRGTPSGFSRIARPLLETAMRRANRKDLDRLKRLIEAR
jgi:uncharacterized protein YndB with AHSA1/START domain